MSFTPKVGTNQNAGQQFAFTPATDAQGMQALQKLQQIIKLLSGPMAGINLTSPMVPTAGSIPTPNVAQSGPPAGKGLTKNPQGWPPGSVQTSGGYIVVPEGKSNAWSVYSPNAKPGDKPHSRVSGDPHVQEKDGTKWDFTKSSDFVLPDGTRIAAQTTSQAGRSLTKGLTITNGADRVDITGIDKNQPQTGNITHDGHEWRAQHVGQNSGRDTFHLGGSESNVQWFKESGGSMEGLVTGAKYDSASRTYRQEVSQGQEFWVDSKLMPPLGSTAFSNMLGNVFSDAASMGYDPQAMQLLSSFLQGGGAQATNSWQGTFPSAPFGGQVGVFSSFGQGMDALAGLGDTMLNFNALQEQLGLDRGQVQA